MSTEKFITHARMYWRADPKNNPDKLNSRVVEFICKSQDDLRLQLDYYIGHNGIVRCESVKPKENADETQSTD